MKKFLLSLLLALPVLGLSSCSDDKDLPDVDFNISVSGATVSDGKIYVVAGETFAIDGINVINNSKGEAMIPYANYFWDFRYIGQSVQAPYGFNIAVGENTPTGEHVLEITAPVYAVDKAPAFTVLDYPVVVVADEGELPDDGVATFSVKPAITDNDRSK